MTPQKYIKEITHAAKQLFKGLSYYHHLLQSVETPVFTATYDNEAEFQRKYDNWLRQNSSRVKAYNEHVKEYFGYAISKAALCGAILQIAFTGMKLHTRKRQRIPTSCKAIFKGEEKSNAKNYCIGRLVYDIPMGLIIYAGRNQYSHMEDKKYNNVTERVFEHLTVFDMDGKYRNPQFDLAVRNKDIYADNIVSILEWTDLKPFLKDMKVMLKCT